MPAESKKNMLQEVQKNLWKIEGKSVVIGCSGGPDSMVVLDLVRRH